MIRGALLLLMASIAVAQQPAFDVASVKLTQHGRTADGWSRSDTAYRGKGRFESVNGSLDELIRYAYNVREYQIVGPSWLNSDEASYDIEARTSPETSEKQCRLMLQTLLAERFRLAAHRESRMYPIYELQVTGKGLKMSAAAPGSHTSMSSGGGKLEARGVSMDGFANWLSREAERPVFDKTALGGAFDFDLQYAVKNDANSEFPSLFTALQQLGLKLEPARGPVEMLLIDHAEKIPTEN